MAAPQGYFITSGLTASADEVDSEVRASGVSAQSGGDIGDVAAAEQGDGGVAAGGECLGSSTGADLGAILIEGDVADVMALVLDAPVAAREGEEGGGIRLSSGEAGDGVSDFALDLAGGLTDALSLDPADLLDMRPGLADAPGVTNTGILSGIGQSPKDASFIAPVLRFGRGVHGDGQGRSASLPLALLPDRQGRRLGRTRRQRQQRGKKRRQCRLPARVGCP